MAFFISYEEIAAALLLLMAKYVCCPLMPLTMIGVMIWDLWIRKPAEVWRKELAEEYLCKETELHSERISR